MKRSHRKDIHLHIRITADLQKRLDGAAVYASKEAKRYVSRSALVCELIEEALSRRREKNA